MKGRLHEIEKNLLVLIGVLLVLFGCSVANKGNPTAKDVLKADPDADILQFNGLIYENAKNHPHIPVLDSLVKKVELGEITKTIQSYKKFKDFYATKLPKGTKVYSTGEENNYNLIVELNNEEIVYTVLLEG